MAINPNTNFTAGAILTADQQNRFPRGVMTFGERTANTGVISAGVETVSITAISFTAVANRYYRITYYDGQFIFGAGHTFTDAVIRQGTGTAGTLIAIGAAGGTATVRGYANVSTTRTFSAGTVDIVATLKPNGGTVNASAGANFPAFLLVEDIGPA